MLPRVPRVGESVQRSLVFRRLVALLTLLRGWVGGGLPLLGFGQHRRGRVHRPLRTAHHQAR